MEVYWSKYKRWYCGSILEVKPSGSGVKWKVLYDDDGMEIWEDDRLMRACTHRVSSRLVGKPKKNMTLEEDSSEGEEEYNGDYRPGNK